MRYVTTETHPELKAGIELTQSSIDNLYHTGNDFYAAHSAAIKVMFEKGCLVRLEEKEFTKTDMFQFSIFFRDRSKNGENHIAFEDEFKAWQDAEKK